MAAFRSMRHSCSLGICLDSRYDPLALAPQSFGSDAGVDLSTYNPIGRLWYVSTGLKF